MWDDGDFEMWSSGNVMSAFRLKPDTSAKSTEDRLPQGIMRTSRGVEPIARSQSAGKPCR